MGKAKLPLNMPAMKMIAIPSQNFSAMLLLFATRGLKRHEEFRSDQDGEESGRSDALVSCLVGKD